MEDRSRTGEREHLFHWVGVLITGRSYLLSLKSRFIRLTAIDQAEPFRIGAARDGIKARYLSKQGTLELDLVIHSRMNAVELLNQRIDLWAEDELTAVHTIRQLGYDPVKILFKSLPLDLKPVPQGYLAFRRDTDKQLVDAFKTALEKLMQTKEYENIKNKYIYLSFEINRHISLTGYFTFTKQMITFPCNCKGAAKRKSRTDPGAFQ